jgi:DNA-binding MarR family transcriptional regulator
MTLSVDFPKNGNTKRSPAGDVSSEKLWIVLRRAYQSISDFLETGVTAKGIAVSDFIVLELLLHNGESPAEQIAKKTRLAAASADATLARLMEQTLIKLRSRRGNLQGKPTFKLTEQGRGLIHRGNAATGYLLQRMKNSQGD